MMNSPLCYRDIQDVSRMVSNGRTLAEIAAFYRQTEGDCWAFFIQDAPFLIDQLQTNKATKAASTDQSTSSQTGPKTA
ncbi:MAG TPA: hypothetical protein VGF13_11930 [Verrucomicrobiae bacterium]|jgi:hypothetical protein